MPFSCRSVVASLFVFLSSGPLDVTGQAVPFICTGRGEWLACIETDRARYAPGEAVTLSLTAEESLDGLDLAVTYLHLDSPVDADTIAATGSEVRWTWDPPIEDGRGYFVDVQLLDAQGNVLDRISTAVDVSGDWKRFPRYGFVSTYANESSLALEPARIESVVRRLNRFHLNGLQFYDWHYKHHQPLRGTADSPAEGWRDVANRPVYFETVSNYIEAAHERGMTAMAYNLLYGAYRDAAQEGVDMQAWGLFTDAAATSQDFHPLPESWASDIMLMNPASPGWQDYIFAAQAEVFRALPFDGWHVDQLGSRGLRYDGDGQPVDLAETYRPFLENGREALGDDVRLVMNAVDQYGQSQIASAPVDFLYSEVWSADTYANLRQVLNDNERASGGRLPSVLAAYMNYDLHDRTVFNTPSVLFTDAVIFASGGSHLELGEHMLSSEYFPSDRLQMTPELERRLIHYYDFLVAYQNLLRGELSAGNLRLESDAATISAFQRLGAIWSFTRETGDVNVAHLINLTDATTLAWRDDAGIQAVPDVILGLPLRFEADRPVRSIWAASPDTNGGRPVTLAFTQEDGQVSFTLPSLAYWTMVVVSYEAESTSRERQQPGDREPVMLGTNFPDPFSAVTSIPVHLEAPTIMTLEVFDGLGQRVRLLATGRYPAGPRMIEWDGRTGDGRQAPSGTYFYRLTTNLRSETKSMVLVR